MKQLKEKWNRLSPKKRTTIKRAIGMSLGAAVGFTYYATIGCSSGHCPITSNPWISTGWGSVIGLTATW